MIERLNLDFAIVSKRKDGIIHTQILVDDTISLKQAELIFNAYMKVGNKTRTPHLITTSKFVILEKEAMEFLVKVAKKHGKADAFVIHSLPQKIIGNFYLQFYKPPIPTKMFSSKPKAITWLKSFLKEPR